MHLQSLETKLHDAQRKLREAEGWCGCHYPCAESSFLFYAADQIHENEAELQRLRDASGEKHCPPCPEGKEKECEPCPECAGSAGMADAVEEEERADDTPEMIAASDAAADQKVLSVVQV